MNLNTKAQRIMLGYLGMTSLLIGAWAQFAPRSFYDKFPGLGRVWVAIDGPYNEHLIRDVGGLNLALCAVLVFALVTMGRTMIQAAAIGSLLYGVPHVVYHIANHSGLDTGDAVASIGGLAVFAVLPLLLLLSARQETGTAAP